MACISTRRYLAQVYFGLSLCLSAQHECNRNVLRNLLLILKNCDDNFDNDFL